MGLKLVEYYLLDSQGIDNFELRTSLGHFLDNPSRTPAQVKAMQACGLAYTSTELVPHGINVTAR